jgi:hypothetical protein
MHMYLYSELSRNSSTNMRFNSDDNYSDVLINDFDHFDSQRQAAGLKEYVIDTCIYVCMYSYLHKYINIYTHIYMHIYIHIHINI